MGEMLIIPVLYSINVPLLMGISISARYFKLKLMNFLSFSSDKYWFIDLNIKTSYLMTNKFFRSVSNESILWEEVITQIDSILSNLLNYFLFVTTSDKSNVCIIFKFFKTFKHRLLYWLIINILLHFVVWWGFHRYQKDRLLFLPCSIKKIQNVNKLKLSFWYYTWNQFRYKRT